MDLYAVDWHSLDWHDEEEDESESSEPVRFSPDCPNEYVVRAFCLDTNGKSAVVDIKGFQPFFYVEIPQKWKKPQLESFISGLKECYEYKCKQAYDGNASTIFKRWYKNTLVGHSVIKAKPFYGFTGPDDKFIYLKLVFSCKAGFMRYGKLLADPLTIPTLFKGVPHVYQRYESNLQPLLRFLHVRNLKAAGWFTVKKSKRYGYNATTCKAHYECNYKDLSPCDREEVPPIVYAGFDIEADSSHGDFPLARKNFQKLAQDMITEYNAVRLEVDYPRYKPLIATFLHYAFNPYYTNFNVKCVTLKEPLATMPLTNEVLQPKKRAKWPGYAQIEEHYETMHGFIEQSNVDALTALFHEGGFPLIEEDYRDVAQNLCKQYTDLKKINAIVVTQTPVQLVKVMLEALFDPYYTNLNINNVFLSKQNHRSMARPGMLNRLVEESYTLCNNAYVNVVLFERRLKRMKKMGVKTTRKEQSKTSQGAVGAAKTNSLAKFCKKDPNKVVEDTREMVLPETTEKNKQDYYVERLTKYLDSALTEQQNIRPEDDAVIQIGTTFKRYGDKDCYFKHIICLNNTEAIARETVIDFEYDGIELPKKDVLAALKQAGYTPTEEELATPEGLKALNQRVLQLRKEEQYKTDQSKVIVECYDTEEEVLLAWRDLIVRTDPDILVGYNIFGFDYKYMYDRAAVLGIADQFTQLGRMKGQTERLVEKQLKSAGLGDNLLHYIEMQGRISIDLYKVMQNMHNLDSYKLDYICKLFLHKKKVDVSPQEIFIKQRGTPAERREVAEYCLIDCVLCNRLVDKFEIITNNIGMAQVCTVPVSYLFLRGQGIKLFSYVAKRCRQEKYLIPVLGEPEDQGKYEGAIVLPAQVGIHETDPVAVADFNSLYPSCDISENLSHDSYIGHVVVGKGESTDFRGKLMTDSVYEAKLLAGEYPGWDYVDITYDVFEEQPVAPGRKLTHKVVVGHKVCRFAQPPDGKKSIIPSIERDLLAARKQTRVVQKQFPKGSFKYSLYEGLQLAYKVTANSLYGIMGASTSQIRFREIAACITATGRGLINFSSGFVLDNYPGSSITYGDTDSIFCKFKCTNRKGERLTGLDAIYKSILLSTESSYLISEQLKAPHNLEFEKAIHPFILLSKKRYHGHYYTEYGSPDFYKKSMGIVLKRRDNPPIVKHVFGGMVDRIMTGQGVDKAIGFVKDECRKVLEGKFPMEMFISTKTLQSYYKNPDQIAHNVLAQRIGKRDPGNKPKGNDRIPFVYIVNPDAENQGDMIETPDFVRQNNLELDYVHYITNQIQKPVEQIFALTGNGMRVFPQLLEEYNPANKGLSKVSQSKGIKMLSSLKIARAGTK